MKRFISFDLFEDCETGDGISGGDDRREGEAFDKSERNIEKLSQRAEPKKHRCEDAGQESPKDCVHQNCAEIFEKKFSGDFDCGFKDDRR